MFLGYSSANRREGRAQRARRTRLVIANAAPAVCESLEGRLLMVVHTWDISWTGPTPTSARLEAVPLAPGKVDVFLNTNTTGIRDFRFENTAGQDLIRTTLTNFTFIDKVPAALKPQFDEGIVHRGIKVQGGTGGTLRIEAGDDDTPLMYRVPSS